jgi:antirestriction protein ArdC
MNTQTQNRSSELAADALNTLIKALESGDSDALTNYLSVMARFHQYSWNNCLLIALQRPGATHVADFHAWHKFGRFVRKGEKGIAILAPVLAKQEVRDEQNPDCGTEVIQQLVGFRTAFVFDVSQTEGRELPEFAKVTGDAAQQLDRLKSFVRSRGIDLRYDASIAPAKGVSFGGRISLLPGLSSGEEFSTLAHEIVHEMLHRDDRRKETSRTIRETEAEAVAFVVCKAVGLDTNTAACDYVKLYNGDAAMLSASLHFVQKTAAEILNALEITEERAA